MTYLEITLKLIIGLSILNVWLFRFGKASQWRGGSAQNLQEEFANYGLPKWFMVLVGTLKVILALILIGSIWVATIEIIAVAGIAAFMFAAVSMHIKIRDPLKKSIPAGLFLILSLIVYWI